MKRKWLWLSLLGFAVASTLVALANRQNVMAHLGSGPFGVPLPPNSYGYPSNPNQPNQPSPWANHGPYAQNVPGPTPVARYGPQSHPNPAFVYASPGAHQDEQRLHAMLMEYQSSKDESHRQALVERITKAVDRQFEERQSVRERELKQLEERLAELKEKHAKRESLKERIVTDRVRQLIDNIEGLGWGTEQSWSPSMGSLPAYGTTPAYGSSPAFGSTPAWAPPGPGLPPGPGHPGVPPTNDYPNAPRNWGQNPGSDPGLGSRNNSPRLAPATPSPLPPEPTGQTETPAAASPIPDIFESENKPAEE